DVRRFPLRSSNRGSLENGPRLFGPPSVKCERSLLNPDLSGRRMILFALLEHCLGFVRALQNHQKGPDFGGNDRIVRGELQTLTQYGRSLFDLIANEIGGAESAPGESAF